MLFAKLWRLLLSHYKFYAEKIGHGAFLAVGKSLKRLQNAENKAMLVKASKIHLV